MQSYVLNEVPEGMLPVGVRMIQVGTCSRKKDAFASVRGLRPSEPHWSMGQPFLHLRLFDFFLQLKATKRSKFLFPNANGRNRTDRLSLLEAFESKTHEMHASMQ